MGHYQTDNPNIVWAEIVVEELVGSGLGAACIAPGSRSTPLTLAFAAHEAVQVFRHLDERSAAFFALGLALGTDRPVALVCTSGTAAANFFPAVIEAHQSQVPLLVLTADRPHELRHSGANQTIDQVKMYGDQVLWSVDMPLPAAAAPPVALRHLRTTAARAYALANGLRKGVVHLNFPFRKPLEPPSVATTARPSEEATDRAFTTMVQGRLEPAPEHIDQLAQVMEERPRGLIVCGPRCAGGAFAEAVAALSRRSGYPILADPLSGVRFGPWVGETAVIGAYETFLQAGAEPWPEPQVIIRFGAVPTSKWLNHYLSRIRAPHRFHIRQSGVWADDSHRVEQFWQVDPLSLCQALAERIRPRPESPWIAQVRQTEARSWSRLESELASDFFDGSAVADVVAMAPPHTRLFAGNSLPVRHLDQFGRPSTTPLLVHANRGASGIDGNLSTGLGLGAAAAEPLVMVVGDVTFYHDLNGLLAAKHLGLTPTIVLLNNNGGGIFRRLPVSRIEPPFRELFITPHDLDFAHAARLYGLDFVRVGERATFRQAFNHSVASHRATVIEVRTDGEQDELSRQRVIKQVIREQPTAPGAQRDINT